jgi:ferredoxin/flavodoxin---NADP+ reductase
VTLAEARVLARTDWADGLWTMQIDVAPDASFRPGQFVNLALELDGEVVRRAYSLASPPGHPAEFYLVRVPGGAFTPRLYDKRIGDAVLCERAPHGFFTLEHVPPARDAWLLATGTGLGPFLSMIKSGELFTRFENVILVHGVRSSEHLGHRGELESIAAARPAFRYLPVTSREPGPLPGRIPTLLLDGRLEGAAQLELSPAHSHVLLCGNPDMIRDATEALLQRGLKKHRKREPGHVTTERYW